MAFDGSNAAHLAALKTEIDTDPQAIGYGENNYQRVQQINDPAHGAAITKDLDDIDVIEVAGAIDDTEYGALSAFGQAWVNAMIQQADGASAKPYKAKFLALFPGGSTTRTAALALLNTTGSRAEELWGYGSRVSRRDIIKAFEV